MRASKRVPATWDLFVTACVLKRSHVSAPALVHAGARLQAVGRGRPVPVRGEERSQRGHRRLRGLLGEPVAGPGNDSALDVVREGLERLPDRIAPAVRTTDGED